VFDRLFDEVLRHPGPSYAMGAALRHLFPDRASIEVVTPIFQSSISA
jgi:hypothetical protein